MSTLPRLRSQPCTPDDRLRIGVLVSGNGSNLQALMDAAASDSRSYRVACVASNVDGAFAIERAKNAQVPVAVISHKGATQTDFEREILQFLQTHDVELVVLAGFMRVLGATFLGRFSGRVINVHPALNPAFPGMHAAQQALEKQVWLTGCTVHIVNDGVDTGPILAQVPVPVWTNDSEAELQKRIQVQEHHLLVQVVDAIARQESLDRERMLRHLVD